MANKWLRHLANFRRNNKDVPAEQVMEKARNSYQGGAPSMPGAMPGAKPLHHPMKLKGGAVVPYEAQGTESAYAKVGGRRRTRRQSRRSRRTRRR
jgi:hypothetical protein